MSDILSVGEVAVELSRDLNVEIRPQDISMLFYRRKLPGVIAPIVAGRRLVPRAALPLIAEALEQTGEQKPVTRNLR